MAGVPRRVQPGNSRRRLTTSRGAASIVGATLTPSRAPSPRATREWITIEAPADPDHLRFTFDVSFLLSRYQCVYGAGCHGIAAPSGSRPDVGCCEHGAYLTDDDSAEELARVVREDLDPSTMANHDTAITDGVVEQDEDDETHTRVVDGACIFSNPADSAAPTGCALHHLDLAEGRNPVTTKPTVCWQLPLHRTIDEQVANDGAVREEHRIEAFERGMWGEGGADFGWWCLEDPEVFTANQPVYRSMSTELRLMVGDDVYDVLASHLDGRRRQHNVPRYLPMI